MQLTIGKASDGRWLAIVSEQRGLKVIVLDVDALPTKDAALKRGREMMVARDWENQ